MVEVDLLSFLTAAGVGGAVSALAFATTKAVKNLRHRRAATSRSGDGVVEDATNVATRGDSDLRISPTGSEPHQPHILRRRAWAQQHELFRNLADARPADVESGTERPSEVWSASETHTEQIHFNLRRMLEEDQRAIEEIGLLLSGFDLLPQAPDSEPPTPEEAACVAPAAEGSIDHALAKLFLQLGPPPEPTENDYAPASNGDGGAQQ